MHGKSEVRIKIIDAGVQTRLDRKDHQWHQVFSMHGLRNTKDQGEAKT